MCRVDLNAILQLQKAFKDTLIEGTGPLLKAGPGPLRLVLTIGIEELRYDSVPAKIGPATLATGGAVSNTGIALRRLGVRTRLMGKVGVMYGEPIPAALLQSMKPAEALEHLRQALEAMRLDVRARLRRGRGL